VTEPLADADGTGTPPLALAPGDRVGGRLTIIDHLASSKRAEIYRCAADGREGLSACKVLAVAYRADRSALRDMEREVKVLSTMHHPHIVEYLSSGTDPVLFLEMGLVPGRSLRAWHSEGTRFTVDEAVRTGLHIADALSHVHSQKILHLDVKPSNVMWDGEKATLIDFSVCHSFVTRELPRSAAGTRDYKSPEQVARARVGPHSDVFGIGATVYWMLAGGHRPFSLTTRAESTDRIPDHTRPPKPLSEWNAAIPPEVERVVLKALSTVPASRYATPGVFGRALAKAAGI
jgi:eukaryotic-like serine/threonine-protein kinase